MPVTLAECPAGLFVYQGAAGRYERGKRWFTREQSLRVRVCDQQSGEKPAKETMDP